MRSFELTFVLALSTAASALPVLESRWWSPYFWAPSSDTPSYLDFGKRVPTSSSNAPVCDLSQAQMPSRKTAVEVLTT